MKRVMLFLIISVAILISAIPVSADGLVGVSFGENNANCSGGATVVVRFTHEGSDTRYITISANNTVYRQVRRGMNQVSATVYGGVYGQYRVVRVGYGGGQGSTALGGGYYYFRCSSGSSFTPVVVARYDRYYIWENRTITLGVRSNDYSPLGWGYSQIYTPPQNGDASFLTGGYTISYTPDDGHIGWDRLVYQACDPFNNCDRGIVDIYTRPLPIATVSRVTLEDTQCNAQGTLDVTISYRGETAYLTSLSGERFVRELLPADTPTGTSTVQIPVSSANGAIVGDNAFKVTLLYGIAPDDDTHFRGEYWFDCVTGEQLDTGVSVQNDSFDAPENFPVSHDILANDTTEVPFDLATLTIDSAPTRGSVNIVDGVATYTYGSDDNFTGTDSFTYTLCNFAGECGSATVTINIVDLPSPTVTRMELTEITCEGPGTLDLTVIYSGGPAVVTVTSAIQDSLVLTSDDISTFGYQDVTLDVSTAGIVVADSIFNFRVQYGTAAGDGSFYDEDFWYDCITGLPVSEDITANNDTVDIPENFPVSFNVLENDSTVIPFEYSTFAIVNPPTRGTVEVGSTGTVTYIYGSDDNFSGTDTFTYSVCNLAGECNTAIVTLNIYDLPPHEILSVELSTITCDAGGAVDVTVQYSGRSAVVTGASGELAEDVLTTSDISQFGVQIVSLPVYTTNGAVVGDNVLILDVSYGIATSDKTYGGRIYYFDCVTGEEITPVTTANDDFVPDVGKREEVAVDVLANDDSRLPFDLSTLRIVGAPEHGTAVILDNQIMYTGNGVFTGDVTVTYEICNTGNYCDTAILTVTVINLPPECSGSEEVFTEVWPPNHKLVPILISGVSDPDGDPITYELVSVTIYELDYVENVNLDDIDFDAENGLIRAERSGRGNGRIYKIEYRAVDPEAQFCEGIAYIYVPHDQRYHGCEIPALDENGEPFPSLPEMCENMSKGLHNINNGNGNNGNNTEPGDPNAPPDQEGDGNNNGLGNDHNNGNAQGTPNRDNDNGGNPHTLPDVPADEVPGDAIPTDDVPETETPPEDVLEDPTGRPEDPGANGRNNGLGNDGDNGRSNSNPNRDTNNGQGNAYGRDW